MRFLLALLLTVLVAGCGAQAVELPEGVTCNDEALATIRENPPDAERAESDQWYRLSYYKSAGCEVPDPSIEPLGS